MRPNLKASTCLAVVLAVGGLLVTAPGRAADAPNAAQIIDQLTPKNGSMVTRGIRMGGAPPEAPRAGVPASTGGNSGGMARRDVGVAQSNLNVPFASGSSTISPAAARVLDQLGQALGSPNLAEFKFRVEGHTDTVGAADMNKSLSEQRAASVVDYLVAKYGIDRGRLTSVGMGEEGLLVQTGDEVPSAANRRVLVVNLGK